MPPKANTKALAELGVMQLMQDPPRLVAFRRIYIHPTTGTRVILHPLPNIAQRSFFQEMKYGLEKRVDIDKVLCEDGHLPVTTDHPRARSIRLAQRFLPFVGTAPITDDVAKFEGLAERDPIESKMAFLSTTQKQTPPLDPRARRGVEHILAYPNNTSVVLPWSAYHMPYLFYALERHGFDLHKNEEVTVVDQRHLTLGVFVVLTVSMWSVYFFLKWLIGW